jgi:hypothetical protein
MRRAREKKKRKEKKKGREKKKRKEKKEKKKRKKRRRKKKMMRKKKRRKKKKKMMRKKKRRKKRSLQSAIVLAESSRIKPCRGVCIHLTHPIDSQPTHSAPSHVALFYPGSFWVGSSLNCTLHIFFHTRQQRVLAIDPWDQATRCMTVDTEARWQYSAVLTAYEEIVRMHYQEQ